MVENVFGGDAPAGPNIKACVYLVWLIAFYLLPGLCLAQTPFDEARISLRSSSVEDGLPNATVYALMLDNRGFLWAGGAEGPAYLGGEKWVPVPFPKEAQSTLVRTMIQTRDGSIWFGTQEDGVWRLCGGHWTHFGKREGLGALRVNCLLETDEGLWAGTWTDGLYLYHGERWMAAHPPQNILDKAVWKLREFYDSDGNPELWVAANEGVAVRGSTGWRRMGTQEGMRDGGGNDFVEVRDPDGKRAIWASCWGHGVARWDGLKWTYWGPEQGFPSRNPICMGVTQGEAGAVVWVGTFDKGMFWFQEGEWRSMVQGVEDNLTGVYALLVNPSRRPGVWAGTRGHGVVSVDMAGWRTLDRSWGLPSRDANAFLETKGSDGRSVFWVGTDRGVSRWENGRMTVEGLAQGLPHDWVSALAVLPIEGKSEVWAGTLRGVARRAKGGWESFPRGIGLLASHCRCLLPVQHDDGWKILAGLDQGLARYHDGSWEDWGARNGLPFIHIFSMHESPDPDGGRSLWVGFMSDGVARYKNGRWTCFDQASGLPNMVVYAIEEVHGPDDRRWIWVSTLGGGLARLDPDRPGARWEPFDLNRLPSLPSNSITGILADEGAGLFVATTQGLSRLQLGGIDWMPRQIDRFYVSDGLPATVTNLGAMYIDSFRRIWVGTPRGVAILDPSLQVDAGRLDRPVFEQALVNDVPVTGRPPFHFTYRQQRLMFRFALPVYFRREEIRYRTQIVGLEPEPGIWQKESWRDYTGLPAGRFLLRVWARDHFGPVPGVLDIPFSVQAPPWKRWWAILIYCTFFLIIIFWRIGQLKRRSRRLAAEVAARTHELALANQSLLTLSLTDPLTGLNNRRFVDVTMGEEVARVIRRHAADFSKGEAGNRGIIFLMLDLDFFKQVNDTHGHHAGDLVLRQMTDLLGRVVRDGDRLVRWGGEEFLVLAHDANPDEAAVLAERIRSTVAGYPFDIGSGDALHLTCSAGFAGFPFFAAQPGRFSWEQTLNLADQCLYRAKEKGRNRWVGLLPRKSVADDEVMLPAKGLRPQDLVTAELAIWHEGPSRL